MPTDPKNADGNGHCANCPWLHGFQPCFMRHPPCLVLTPRGKPPTNEDR